MSNKKKKSLTFHNIYIEKKGETKVFSRGELTNLFNYIGISLGTAFSIATRIKGELIRKKVRRKFEDPKTGKYEISSDDLCEIIRDELIDFEKEGLLEPEQQLPEKYIFWRNVRNSREPVLILLSGGTAVGTTSIGRNLEKKINSIIQSGTNPIYSEIKGLFNLVMTDHVRDTIRGFCKEYPSKEELKELFVSTYDAGKAIHGSKAGKEDVIDGFERQTKIIQAGLNRVIERDLLYRGSSLIIEGIHVIPCYVELLKPMFDGTDLLNYAFEYHITIPDDKTHLSRLRDRQKETSLRSKRDYVGRYDDIKVVKGFLLEQANQQGVPVINNSNPNELKHQFVSQYIMNDLFERLRYSDRYDIRSKGSVTIKR